jgi:chromate transport protein ChrA
MSEDQLKRMIGVHAALAFLLLPGLCALPLLALISPAPARYLFAGVWALLALALAAIVARVAVRLRRAADSERWRKSTEQ